MSAYTNPIADRSASTSTFTTATPNDPTDSPRRKSKAPLYDKPSRELLDELYDGPVLSSNAGTHASVTLNHRDQMLSHAGSTGSLFGDFKDTNTQMKNSW